MPNVALNGDFDIDRYLNHFVPRSRVHNLPKPLAWMLGHRSSPPAQVGSLYVWFWAFFGAVAGLLVVEAVFQTDYLASQGTPTVIASLGAAAILEYNVIESPLSQPRNAILGQLFSALIGVGLTKLFQLNANFEKIRWVAGALAVGISSAVMGITKTIHPPAGATALLAATSPDITILGWFLVPLVMLGSVLMIVVALVVNNISRQFPLYFWTPTDLSLERSAEGRNVGSLSHQPGGDNQISIDAQEGITIPQWLDLDVEEKAMMETLRRKLQGARVLEMINTRGTEDTLMV